MKKIKKDKGITLIALVVTIIIILILAGISIMTLTGNNGIVSKTISARDLYEKATIIENLDLANGAININYYRNLKNKSLTSYYTNYIDYTSPSTFIQNSNYDNTSYSIQSYEVFRVGNMNYAYFSILGKSGNTYNFVIKLDDDSALEGISTEMEVGDIEDDLNDAGPGELIEVTQKNNTYIINYILNGGSNPSNALTVGTIGRIQNYPKPKREGYAFRGWYKNADFSGEKVTKTEKNVNTSEITLYAKWDKEINSDYFIWHFDETTHTASISGFSENGLTEYNNGNITNLVFPEKYSGTDEENSEYVGYSLTEIEDYDKQSANQKSFYNCTLLQGTLSFPDSVTKIGNEAFSGCTGITTVILGDNIESIGSASFSECTSLEDLTAPISIDLYIGDGKAPFSGDIAIKKIVLTEGKTGIGFNYTSSKKAPWHQSKQDDLSIEIEEGVKTIGEYTFFGCNINSFKWPNSLERIEERAFYQSGIIDENMKLSNSLSYIGKWAFRDCKNISGEIILPENLKIIDECAFYGCENIGKIVIPNGLTTLGKSAFSGCTSLTDVTVPITLDLAGSSGGYIFNNSNAITKITLTSGGNGIGAEYGTSNYSYTPWNRNNTVDKTVVFEKGIVSIGKNSFKGTKNVQYQFKGTKEEFNINIDDTNTALLYAVQNEQIAFSN